MTLTMNERTIITFLLALVAMAGQAQVKCHVIGTVADGVERQTFYIAQQGTTDNDDAKWTEVNVKDGSFTLDIKADKTEMYEIIEDRCSHCPRVGHELLPSSHGTRPVPVAQPRGLPRPLRCLGEACQQERLW